MIRKRTALLAACGVTLFAAGCHTDMWVQPHLRPQTLSEFGGFADHMTSRMPVPGTVARGEANDDAGYFTGRQEGKYVTDLPLAHAMDDLNKNGIRQADGSEFTPQNPQASFKAFLQRGQERFTIYCTPCHGQLGDGNGMIAQRGFALRRQPATYHTDRLRKMPIGHFFDVMTNGYGTMYSYAARVETPDRWAIAAYIRILQQSQNQKAQDLPPDQQSKVEPDLPAPEAVR